jgi:hypothetical protein
MVRGICVKILEKTGVWRAQQNALCNALFRAGIRPSPEAPAMGFSMASLLVHSEEVPLAARDAIRAAHKGPAACRRHRLESAARILQRETGVGCPDARELVDLQPADC